MQFIQRIRILKKLPGRVKSEDIQAVVELNISLLGTSVIFVLAVLFQVISSTN
jgi:hypothetical protein